MIPGIGSWLTKRELLSPDKEAIVDGRRRLTYFQLNRRVNRLSNALSSLGLKRGDRVSILSHNCIEFVEVIMAAAKLGLLLVPLNWRLTPVELAYNINDSGSESLFFDPHLGELAQGVLDKAPFRRQIVFGSEETIGSRAYEPLLAEASDEEPFLQESPDLDTPHIIMYTAGTTGRPKGAVLTQGASFWNAANLTLAGDFTSHDRDLAVLPMFHIGGIGLFTLPMLYVGGTVIIQRAFDPLETINLLKNEKITLFFGVPAVFLFLIQQDDFDAKAFDRVRLIMSGGAPLPLSLIRQYHEAGVVLQQGFGMSEAAPSIATLSKELAIKKAGSIGQPVFHLDARIVDDDMQDISVNEVGELVIRGPNVMQGYWKKPEATEEAFRGGWFHTGDLARMDKDGALYIVDRKKDMFISGGENVYPAEVENAIFELPQVAEAAVIGIKDEKWGEVGRAVLVLKPDAQLSREEVLDFLGKRLAKFKVPKQLVFAEKLPRNAAGKVLKNQLREKGA
jgi:fatty-acyl-CoA synthase